jgi:hypothetical protein
MKKHVFDTILSTPLHHSIGQSNMSMNTPFQDKEAHHHQQHQEQNLIMDSNDYPEFLHMPSNHVPLSRQSSPSEKKVMSFAQRRHQDLNAERFRRRSQGGSLLGKKRSPDVFRSAISSSSSSSPEDSFSSSSRLVTPFVIRQCQSEPFTTGMIYQRRLKMRRASGSSTSIANALFIDTSISKDDDPFSSCTPLPKLVPFSPSEYSPSKEEDGQQGFVDVSAQVHPSNILFPRLD